ncbi:hypothetical protein RvY_13936 [Ramazzottius varieornatus]|uniref:Amidase domain-containing protein n=1 Tax=Ramazzottius varieornatus TaxID=947166 RepID=A0A1D1VY40_RAMVA|nr:hypothetical protein RvY_13936 [Ramazzottius varieornatus]
MDRLKVEMFTVDREHLSVVSVVKTVAFYWCFLVRIILDCVTDVLFGLYYSAFHPRVFLPAPRSTLLLESATFLSRKIRAREIRSADVVEEFITRIKDVNPIINAVVADRFEEARREARQVDRLLESGSLSDEFSVDKKPFLGVPFTCKECMRVVGLPNTSGLYLRKGFVAKEDADCVRLMRAAGGIALAVSNVSEICMWWESSNKIYGQTRNPYDTRRTVGGSSGGEAALLASCGSPMGIGSDIGGSIRMPAFFNGIFGHKPTFGLVSNAGQFPDASGALSKFLVTGPMCRFSEDLIPMYKVLLASKADRLLLDQPVDLSKLKLYFAVDDGGFPLISPVQTSIKKALMDAVHHLESRCGAEMVSFEPIKPLRFSLDVWSSMMSMDDHTFTEDMANREGKVNPYTELAKWFLGLSPHTFPAVALGLTEEVTAKFPERQEHFVQMCAELEETFVKMLGPDGVFIYPTHPRTAPFHHQPLLMPFNFAYTAIFNVLGLPSTHIPLGLDSNNLPLGVQVVSNHYNDRFSLAVAKELERAFGGWLCP